jgi:hypothetical protein
VGATGGGLRGGVGGGNAERAAGADADDAGVEVNSGHGFSRGADGALGGAPGAVGGATGARGGTNGGLRGIISGHGFSRGAAVAGGTTGSGAATGGGGTTAGAGRAVVTSGGVDGGAATGGGIGTGAGGTVDGEGAGATLGEGRLAESAAAIGASRTCRRSCSTAVRSSSIVDCWSSTVRESSSTRERIPFNDTQDAIAARNSPKMSMSTLLGGATLAGSTHILAALRSR